MKQTSIEWLRNELWEQFKWSFSDNIFEVAKEMHKQEIIDAHHCGRAFENKYPESEKTYNESGKQYYQETFK